MKIFDANESFMALVVELTTLVILVICFFVSNDVDITAYSLVLARFEGNYMSCLR